MEEGDVEGGQNLTLNIHRDADSVCPVWTYYNMRQML